MRIAYYPETDSMYIDLSHKESAESDEVSPRTRPRTQSPEPRT